MLVGIWLRTIGRFLYSLHYRYLIHSGSYIVLYAQKISWAMMAGKSRQEFLKSAISRLIDARNLFEALVSNERRAALLHRSSKVVRIQKKNLGLGK